MTVVRMKAEDRVALLEKVCELLDCAIVILDDVFPDNDYVTGQVTNPLRSIAGPDLFSDSVNISDLMDLVRRGEVDE